MSFWSDDRAAAIQVGAIVLFSFVVIAIAAYQASVVPDQNKQVEFDHNQQVQRQLEGLQGVIGSTPTAGGAQTVVVETSTNYPARTIFVNPPPPTGVLRTVGTGDESIAFEVRNAEATGETRDFWDGRTHNYTTGAVAYRPNYNAYSQAPVSVVENSVVYNRFADQTIVRNAQSIFDGRKITLVAVNGSFREQGGAASVTVRPVSASSNRVEVASDGGGPVTIQIVTRMGNSPSTAADRWRTILDDAGEYDGSDNDPNAYVAAVTGGNEVTLPDGTTAYQVAFELETGTTYSLALAKAGVGSNVNATPSSRYATRASPRNVSTTAGAKETIAVEVRDEYNNPIAGVPMNATIESGSGTILESDMTETEDDGVVRFTYQAPNSATTARVNVTIAKAGGETAAATFNVSVSKSSGGGGGNGAYNVTWYNPADSTPSGAAQVTCSQTPPNGQCTIDANGESSVDLPMVMYTDPVAHGASVTYSVSNQTVGTFSRTSGETNSSGENETTLTVDRNGTVTTYVTSGAGGDRVTFDVINLASGPAPTCGGAGSGGSNVNLQSSSVEDADSDGTSAALQFTIENTGSNCLNITQIEVNQPSGPGQKPDFLVESNEVGAPWDHEVSISGLTNGFLEDGDGGAGYALGNQYVLTEKAQIDSGGTATVYLYEFNKRQGGTDTPSELTGYNQITITVYFEDGSSVDITITL